MVQVPIWMAPMLTGDPDSDEAPYELTRLMHL